MSLGDDLDLAVKKAITDVGSEIRAVNDRTNPLYNESRANKAMGSVIREYEPGVLDRLLGRETPKYENSPADTNVPQGQQTVADTGFVGVPVPITGAAAIVVVMPPHARPSEAHAAYYSDLSKKVQAPVVVHYTRCCSTPRAIFSDGVVANLEGYE